jgi:hypothetical protein
MGTDEVRRTLIRELLAQSSFGELADTTAADDCPAAVIDTLARAQTAPGPSPVNETARY